MCVIQTHKNLIRGISCLIYTYEQQMAVLAIKISWSSVCNKIKVYFFIETSFFLWTLILSTVTFLYHWFWCHLFITMTLFLSQPLRYASIVRKNWQILVLILIMFVLFHKKKLIKKDTYNPRYCTTWAEMKNCVIILIICNKLALIL